MSTSSERPLHASIPTDVAALLALPASSRPSLLSFLSSPPPASSSSTFAAIPSSLSSSSSSQDQQRVPSAAPSDPASAVALARRIVAIERVPGEKAKEVEALGGRIDDVRARLEEVRDGLEEGMRKGGWNERKVGAGDGNKGEEEEGLV